MVVMVRTYTYSTRKGKIAIKRQQTPNIYMLTDRAPFRRNQGICIDDYPQNKFRYSNYRENQS